MVRMRHKGEISGNRKTSSFLYFHREIKAVPELISDDTRCGRAAHVPGIKHYALRVLTALR